MRDYLSGIRSVTQVLDELEKSGELAARERLLIDRLLKKLMRAIRTKDEKTLRKTIDELCRVFVKEARR